MATGKQHITGTIVLSPVTAGSVWWLTGGDVTTAAVAGTGCLSGLFVNPDLDMETVTLSEYWLVRWTLGLGWLWIMLWYPYALLARHRSWFSHAPIISTMGRVSYMVLLYVGIAVLLRYFLAIELFPFWALLNWEQWFIFVGGLTISDLGHWWLDR
ncbi:MAG: DUF2227 family putative metal-binding protein [Chloroflexota bacterium]